MAQALQPQEESFVFLEGNELKIIEFRETDPEVVKVVSEADDCEQAVHRCLQVGARALSFAQIKLDSKIVEAEFAKLEGRLRGGIEEGVSSIKATSDRFLDPKNGEVTKSLSDWKNQVRDLLAEPFNEDSKSSIVAKLETVLQNARKEQMHSMLRILNADDPDTPLGRWKNDVTQVINERAEAVLVGFTKLAQEVAVKRAVDQVLEKTSGKGFSFEEDGHEVVTQVTCVYGDIAEAVGKTPGILGKQIGDELITINPDEADARYVIEFKDRKLGVKAILDELDDAMANRQASAAIAIFSSSRNSPVRVPFQIFGNKAIATLDKETLDEGPISVACMWARYMALRESHGGQSLLDVKHIESLIEKAARSLVRVSTVKRAHSMAKKKIDEAGNQVNDMAEEVRDILETLQKEIRK